MCPTPTQTTRAELLHQREQLLEGDVLEILDAELVRGDELHDPFQALGGIGEVGLDHLLVS